LTFRLTNVGSSDDRNAKALTIKVFGNLGIFGNLDHAATVMEPPMDTNKKNRERISALCDDALPKDDHELASAALRTDEGRAAWEVYHLIGDMLRTGESADLSPGFSSRLAARLAAEPLHPRRPASHDAERVKPVVLAASSSSS
jgi:sigma-E factor negative regulatory protein RseA